MAGFSNVAIPVFLQIFRETFPIQDNQLVQDLVPVPVSLGPFLCYILARQVQHFSKDVSLGNTLFVLVTLRYWRFSPSMMFVVYMIRRMSSGNWKKELTSSQLFSQLLTARGYFSPPMSLLYSPVLKGLPPRSGHYRLP